jgi:dimethylglycine dehydrogenase
MMHQYVLTENVPQFENLPRELPVVRDYRMVSGYIRMEQKSALIGIYEQRDAQRVWENGAPWESENELFDPDLDRLMPWLGNAMDRVPALERVGIKRVVNGAVAIPPDGAMLLGPAPGLQNFWCCCGAQAGISWGPGAGKYLAQWITSGAPEASTRDWDPRRFGQYADRKYQFAKAYEDYCMHYAPPLPGYNRQAGRPVRTSPLYDRLKDAGAVYEETFGWERPRWFARDGLLQHDVYSFGRPNSFVAVGKECRSVRDHAGIMDLTAFGKIDVTGPDAESFLARVLANTPPSKVGGIRLAHMLNEKGTIESEMTVARLGSDRFYLALGALSEIRTFDWMQHHRRPRENVRIEVVSEAYGCLVLCGPKARQILRRICRAPLDNGNFPWLTSREMEAAGAPVRALRISYAGELGWELHVRMEHMLRVYDALWEVGAPQGLENFGSFALRAMGLEKAYKAAPELTNDVNMVESDMMRFVKLDRDDFIGRTATLRHLEAPPKWKCVYLALDGDNQDCLGAEAVYRDEHKVGMISSGNYGHRVNKSLAFAYVDPSAAAVGTELRILVQGKPRKARILAGPLYDASNDLPRATT